MKETPIRLLVFSTLYPNAAMPRHGVFVENRLRHVLATGEVAARVVAPVPWFPLDTPLFKTYRAYARAPKTAERHGIAITHPRYPLIPKIGMRLTPSLMYRSAARHIDRLIAQGFDFDLIDAHYFYPDGVAAVRLGQRYGKPVVITGRGTDLNLIPQIQGPRQAVIRAARQAAHCITVSAALKAVLTDDLGIAEDHVTVLRNGVDLTLFTPRRRGDVRAGLDLDDRPVLLSVGHLIDRKGHHLIIDAMGELPDATLLIAGDGPNESALKARARDRGVADRVRFLGAVPHESLADIYSAADLLVLASDREGWANVLLEAMACGTPVAATAVWGAPELITDPDAGALIPERSAGAIAATARALLKAPPRRAATRAFAEQFSWQATSAGQLKIFRAALAQT